MKTVAAVLEKQNEPLSIMELEVPALREGHVLVQMVYSGICQSQLNEMRGYKGHDPYLPHTLGHEGAGIVLEVGSKVTKVKPGDPVVLSWIKGSGLEGGGTKYFDGTREVNSGPISTFLSHAVVSENRIIPIPSSMPLREAALLGCAMPTGAGVIFHEMKLRSGQSIALFGLGGIGLSALIAASYAGANPIIAVDVNQEKLQLAREFGATHCIDASRFNAKDEILKITALKGVDYSLEAAGRKEVIESAYSVVRASGGLCIVAGNIPQGKMIEIDPFDLIRGKGIKGTWGGSSDIDRDICVYVEMFSSQKLPLARLITHEAPLLEINNLCNAMMLGQVGRGLIKF